MLKARRRGEKWTRQDWESSVGREARRTSSTRSSVLTRPSSLQSRLASVTSSLTAVIAFV